MSVIYNLIDIYKRAAAQKALTPQERAFLKAVFGVFVGLLSVLVPQIPGLFAGTAHINWVMVAFSILLIVVCLTVAKLWNASTPEEQAAGQLLEYYAEEILKIVEGEIAVTDLPKYVDPHKTTSLQNDENAGQHLS